MERQTVRDAHVPVGDAVPFGALSSAYDIYSHGGTFDVGDVASCQGPDDAKVAFVPHQRSARGRSCATQNDEPQSVRYGDDRVRDAEIAAVDDLSGDDGSQVVGAEQVSHRLAVVGQWT